MPLIEFCETLCTEKELQINNNMSLVAHVVYDKEPYFQTACVF